ncbi:MAG: MFS transporter [Nitrosomonadales bacterium]|nr:MFS transporter [Nitrosomonadales bacterium]
MVQKDRMTPSEIKASSILASIYALRMLGIFLILPIFSIYAADLPSQPSAFQIGLALGIYGLTQAIFQIPFGMISDFVGRKKVIYFGLILFIIGSLIAGLSNEMELIILGRAIQGAGAISAVLSALLADLTSDESRTKAMGIVGVSIGLTFALSLVLSPILNKLIGVPGIFILMGILSFIAIIVIKLFIVEAPKKNKVTINLAEFLFILKRWDLNRLNLGIFVLHATQISLFIVIPYYLISNGGIPLSEHWSIYLPILFLSFIFMVPMIIFSQRWNLSKQTFLISIVLLFLSQFLFINYSYEILNISLALLIYFIGFNFLEASLPSLVSRIAPIDRKGFSLGVYNTCQSLGMFFGGVVGGLAANNYGYIGVFYFCGIIIFIWFIFSLSIKMPDLKRV